MLKLTQIIMAIMLLIPAASALNVELSFDNSSWFAIEDFGGVANVTNSNS